MMISWVVSAEHCLLSQTDRHQAIEYTMLCRCVLWKNCRLSRVAHLLWSLLLQRTGRDHQGVPVWRGWTPSNETWQPTTSHWTKQSIWLRTILCGGWCQRMALCTPSGACQKWCEVLDCYHHTLYASLHYLVKCVTSFRLTLVSCPVFLHHTVQWQNHSMASVQVSCVLAGTWG